MGLFSFGKKKKAKEPDTKERAEQEALKFLEDFNKENGNYASSFYFAHKKEADRHETQVVNARVLARDAKDHRERLKALQECKKNLDDFCAWCHKYKYGDLYYQEWIGGRPGVPSYYESLVEDLNREQRIEDYIIPAIVSWLLLKLLGSGILTVLIVLIIGIVFAFAEFMAICRLAKTDSLGEALAIGEAIGDISKVGMLKVLLTVIAVIVIGLIIAFIFALIARVNGTIGTILLGIFGVYFVFFANRAVGLLYSDV